MQVQSTKVERHCERCGAPFLTQPSWIAKGRGRFCSRPCVYADLAARLPQPVRQSAVTRPCEHCGTAFRTYQSIIDKGFGRFCSKTCSQLSRRQNEVEACTRCSAPLYRKRQIGRPYCSKACQVAAQHDRARSPADRFWSKVDKAGPTPQHRPELGSCWVWMGYRNPYRRYYGLFIIRKRAHYAHRYSWTLHFGPIPDGLQVLHKCDNPPCVRPDHLFLGTQQDNMDDMWAKGRAAAQARISTATEHSPPS